MAARCANSVAANRIAPCAQNAAYARTYMTPVRSATSLDVHDACLADPQLTTSVVARVDVMDQAAPTTSFWCFGTRGPHRCSACYCLANHCAEFRSRAIHKSWGPAHSLLLPAPSVLCAETRTTRGPDRKAAYQWLGQLYANCCSRMLKKSSGPRNSLVSPGASLLYF